MLVVHGIAGQFVKFTRSGEQLEQNRGILLAISLRTLERKFTQNCASVTDHSTLRQVCNSESINLERRKIVIYGECMHCADNNAVIGAIWCHETVVMMET